MFKHRMEIVHNHGNGFRFSQERVNFHNAFQWQKIHTSSNVLHYTALSQKCIIDVVHYYSYPSALFYENYTLAQFYSYIS